MESETFDTIDTFDNTDAPRYLMTPSYTIGTSDTPTPLTPLIPLFSTSSGFVSMKNNGSAIFFLLKNTTLKLYLTIKFIRDVIYYNNYNDYKH